MVLLGHSRWDVHEGHLFLALKKALVPEVLLSPVVARSLFGDHRGCLLPRMAQAQVLPASAL